MGNDTKSGSTNWKVIAAKVAGFSHLKAQIPCQDHVAFELLGSDTLVAVLCDGAGSAAMSEFGAWFVAETLVVNFCSAIECLGDEFVEYLAPQTTRYLEEFIKVQVAKTREALSSVVAEGRFDDYHCTLVGVIAGQKGCVFFHIGDGVGIATRRADLSNAVSSDPANGEYVNETYFCTSSDWLQRLRITTFDAGHDLICLFSDGSATFMTTSPPSKLASSIAPPICSALATLTEDEGVDAFVELFSREKIRSITGDDKSVLWAMRGVLSGAV